MSAVAAMAQMPRYQSHKRVWALKIAAVEGHRLAFADAGFATIECLPEMFLRHHPEPGDYLVEYEGGYRSFSPRAAFEDGYRPCSGLTFGDALDLLKAGKRVARAGWNGKGMWLSLTPGNPGLPAEKFWSGPNRAFAEENGGSAPVLPSITMKTATGEILIGWLASQSDMLAEDWREVPSPASAPLRKAVPSQAEFPAPRSEAPSPECPQADTIRLLDSGSTLDQPSPGTLPERLDLIHEEFRRRKQQGLQPPSWSEIDRLMGRSSDGS